MNHFPKPIPATRVNNEQSAMNQAPKPLTANARPVSEVEFQLNMLDDAIVRARDALDALSGQLSSAGVLMPSELVEPGPDEALLDACSPMGARIGGAVSNLNAIEAGITRLTSRLAV